MSKQYFDSKKGSKCPGFVAGENNNSKKGLIVIQEWWGLNKQIEDEASLIAEMGGFVTISPDLYRGKIAKDNEEAGHFMNDLDWPGAVDDIRGAAIYLKSKGCTKVGVTGFCMGGALSLAAAALVPEIDAAAPFYGIPGDALADVSKITKPLQCHFAAKDSTTGFACPESQKKLKAKLDAGKVAYEWKSYDAEHAFTNTTSPNYNKECCDLALREMVQFMKKNLS